MRSKSGNLIQTKPGGIYLAWKAGVPILPVAITGCEDSVVKDRLKHFNRLHIKVVAGPSFMLAPIAGKDRNALMQHYNNEMMCCISARLPKARGGFYAGYPRLKEVLAN